MFIIWRGSDKSPIDPLHADPASRAACLDAQPPRNWLSWDIAQAYAQSLGAGYGVGVVLHDGCGLLCVDIDKCMVEGVASPVATKLVREARRLCPDVYVEISMSGRGIHIIGPFSGDPPLHSTKNQEHHIELYHRARYIALTGVPCPLI
jgi:primase-polymerase (primpol)-like protein